MAHTLLAALLVCGVIQTAPTPSTSAAPTEKVKLFLGAVPGKDGFVNTNKTFQESYRDMEKAYRKDPALQATLTLVTKLEDADLSLEVILRKSTAFHGNFLTARLCVVGSDYTNELDGRVGVVQFAYQTLAKNLLRRTVKWVEANRAALDKVRASRAPKDAAL